MVKKKLSKKNQAVIIAYDKGYRVVDGEVFSPEGNQRKISLCNKSTKGTQYYCFSIRGYDGTHYVVPVHRLVAYQKYGKKMFWGKKEVRHLDGNSLNNTDENIGIGSRSDNMKDRPLEERQGYAIKNFATKNRRFTDAEVAEIRRKKFEEGYTYAQLKEEYGVRSNGSMQYILYNNYVTTKE